MSITKEVPIVTERIDWVSVNEIQQGLIAHLQETCLGKKALSVELALLAVYGQAAQGLRCGEPSEDIMRKRVGFFTSRAQETLTKLVVEIGTMDPETLTARLASPSTSTQ